MQKKWRHDKDGGEVSRVTGICGKCGEHPKGNEITLINNKKVNTNVIRVRSRSERNMRYENLLGINSSLLRHPRQ